MLVDVHAHLTYEKFDEDVDEVINKFKGIIITNGTFVEDNRKVLKLSKKYSNVKPALGIYPGHIIEMSDDELKKELKFIEENKPIAIGEVGLDGTYENMLHYAHNLKNPITMLHMLGVILPILGLVIFPLIGAFMSGSIKWYHLFILYNILFHAGVKLDFMNLY